MAVRDAHDDPLDHISVSQDTDVHERSAPSVDTLEREQRVSPASADHRKQRDVVAPNSNNNRVVDERGYAVPDVELQEVFPRIDDSFGCPTVCLVCLKRFERLSETHLSADNDEV